MCSGSGFGNSPNRYLDVGERVGGTIRLDLLPDSQARELEVQFGNMIASGLQCRTYAVSMPEGISTPTVPLYKGGWIYCPTPILESRMRPKAQHVHACC